MSSRSCSFVDFFYLKYCVRRKAIAKRSSSLEAWRLLAEVAGMVGDYTQMENAITEANNIYDDILKKSVEDGALISKRSAAAIYHQLATSFMAVSFIYYTTLMH